MISPYKTLAKSPFRAFSLLFLIIALLLGSCSNGRLGYGILLWSPDEVEAPTGSLLNIRSESRLQRNYLVEHPLNPGQFLQIDTWRIQMFPKLDDAQEFSAEYRDFVPLYGESQRLALPMRERPSAQSLRVYKLDEGQLLKLISREPGPVQEGNLEGYWYRALTSDGYTGYVFDYALDIFDIRQERVTEEDDGDGENRDLILENIWRPGYFPEMIRTRNLDLQRFQNRFALTFSPEENVARLVLPEHTVEFRYESISRTGQSSYLLDGANLRINLESTSRISLQYNYRNQTYTQTMVLLDTDLDSLIQDELSRRAEVLDSLVQRGPFYLSPAYGEWQIKDNGEFTWNNFQRLIPLVLPEGTPGQGRLEFDHFLTQELRQRHGGALRLVFNGTGGQEGHSSVFLYTFDNNGLRLIHIPPADIENRTVQRVGQQSVTIFFSPSRN